MYYLAAFALTTVIVIVIVIVISLTWKLWFLGHQISWVSDRVRDFSAWASSAMEAANEMKSGTKVAQAVKLLFKSTAIPKRKIRFPGHQISSVSDWMSTRFSSWASSAMEIATETKFGTKVPRGWGWCPNVEYPHSAEKAHDTTLHDKKYDMHCSDGAL